MAVKVLVGTPANGGSSAGDMTKAVYDPQNINADAFDRSNHTGTQSISTITDLQTELDDKLKQGENILTEETTFELTGSSKKLKVTFDDRKLIFIVEDISTGDYSEFYIDDSSLESVISVGSDVNRVLLNGVITFYSEIQGKGIKLNDRSVDEANVDFLTDDDNLLTIGKAKENLALKGVLTQSGGNVTGSIDTTNNTFSLNASGGGGGDMTKVVYDPQNINADAFDRANHTGTQPISTITDLQNELDSKTNETDFVNLGNAFGLHVTNYNNPHQTDKDDIGLDQVDNTSDLNKPISTATQNVLDNKTNKALTQTLVNSTPKVISSTDSDTTFNVYGVGALCEFTINTGSLNVGEAFEINIGDSGGVDVIGGAGVNIFGLITGSTTIGDSLLVRRIPNNSFGLTGEVYKVY